MKVSTFFLTILIQFLILLAFDYGIVSYMYRELPAFTFAFVLGNYGCLVCYIVYICHEGGF
ncbi:hypothetical protein [Caudoviricetes sp.]|nr:hypothetical protein [Caudoviricetes sp.]